MPIPGPSGSVIARKRKDGEITFSAVAYYGRDAKGRQIRRWSSGHPSKKLADKALREMLNDETWIPSDGSSVETLVKAYLSSCRDRGVEATTLMRYESTLAQHIAPFIGAVHVDALRGDRLDKLYGLLLREGGLKKRPLSQTTVKYAHDLLNTTYKWAVRKRLISRNPVADADPPKRRKSRGKAMKLEDAHKILVALRGHRMEAPILLSLATGMRRGEIAGLRYRNVDVEAGVIHVVEALANGGKGNVYVKAPKTDEPRDVPLLPTALEAVRVARLNRAKWKLAAGQNWVESDYVFTDEMGRRLHPNVLTDAFRRIVATLGLKHHLHEARHTAATFMLRAGKDLNTVQQILGHSVASTTLNIYGHVMTGAKKDALGALDQMLRPSGTDPQ